TILCCAPGGAHLPALKSMRALSEVIPLAAWSEDVAIGEPAKRTPSNPAAVLSPRQTIVLALVCGGFGLVAWVFYICLHTDPVQDWMVFYTAARAYLDGNLPLLFDGEALTAALNQRFASWMAFTLNLHPWVYPPPFLLLFLPFALLPPIASATVFLLSGFVVLAVV